MSIWAPRCSAGPPTPSGDAASLGAMQLTEWSTHSHSRLHRLRWSGLRGLVAHVRPVSAPAALNTHRARAVDNEARQDSRDRTRGASTKRHHGPLVACYETEQCPRRLHALGLTIPHIPHIWPFLYALSTAVLYHLVFKNAGTRRSYHGADGSNKVISPGAMPSIQLSSPAGEQLSTPCYAFPFRSLGTWPRAM